MQLIQPFSNLCILAHAQGFDLLWEAQHAAAHFSRQSKLHDCIRLGRCCCRPRSWEQHDILVAESTVLAAGIKRQAVAPNTLGIVHVSEDMKVVEACMYARAKQTRTADHLNSIIDKAQ